MTSLVQALPGLKQAPTVTALLQYCLLSLMLGLRGAAQQHSLLAQQQELACLSALLLACSDQAAAVVLLLAAALQQLAALLQEVSTMQGVRLAHWQLCLQLTGMTDVRFATQAQRLVESASLGGLAMLALAAAQVQRWSVHP